MDPQDAGRSGARAPEPLQALVDRLEQDERWDVLADALDDAGAPLASGPGGPALRGEWLGHALHPLLTDIPLGCWTSASVLDVLGGKAARPAAQRLVGLGVLTALPTALSGLVDLAAVDDRRLRRVGAVHASGNSVALLTYLMSWRARRHDHHLRGALLALAGGTVATFTGYLGGHLSFGRGVGVGARGIDELGEERSEAAGAASVGAEPVGAEAFASEPSRGEAMVRGSGTTDLLGVEEVADELTMPVEQVRTLVEEGLLPAARTEPLGFRAADVQAVRLQGG